MLEIAALSADPDTPRSAFSVLSWRINLAVVLALVALSAVAWMRTVSDARSMSGMVMGLGQLGSRMQGSMGAALFFTMWVTMMTAMMLPTAAPMVLAHMAVARRRGDGTLTTFAFVGGYLIVWFAIGFIALLVHWAVAAVNSAPLPFWLPLVAGAILVLAGAYQFTTWKHACFDKCQSPFAFVAMHDFSAGVRGALRAGLIHGVFCLGCCWALMTVLLVVGLMNLLWMAGIFLVFFLEKQWRHGLALARFAGAALIALGLGVIASPALLALISR
jgi:predicted metal-binding membrane protein